MISNGQAAFQARINRIDAGQCSRVPVPGVSEDTGGGWMASTKSLGLKSAARVRAKVNPVGLVFAFLLGLVAFLLAQYAIFKLSGLPDPSVSADTRMVMDGVFGGIIAICLSVLFSLKGKAYIMLKFAGICAAMVTMHNLVHLFPEHFTLVFSGEWVQATLSQTEANSILFRGETFKLI